MLSEMVIIFKVFIVPVYGIVFTKHINLPGKRSQIIFNQIKGLKHNRFNGLVI